VLGEDLDLAERHDAVVVLRGGKVLPHALVLGQVGEDVGEVVEVGLFVVAAVLALDEQVHELVDDALGRGQLRGRLLRAVYHGQEGIVLGDVGEEHGLDVGVGFLWLLEGHVM